jgi:PKD repeat protein
MQMLKLNIMNIMLRLIFFATLLIMHFDLLFADTLILKSGKVIECKILEKGGDYIKVEYAGQPLYYECKYIQQINQSLMCLHSGASRQSISAEQWSKAIADEKELKSRNSGIKAAILTNTSQGFSPLKVVFNGLKSFSPAGRIISYYWDLGDGDVSYSPKARNTYISMSYGPRVYVVKLTIEDEKGNTASEYVRISVTNKNL